MTWYSCRYDNKRTLNIMIEVAFDDPDNTSLFLSSSDIQLLSVKFDQQALSFRPVFSFSFFYFFYIYIYIYNFFILSLWSWWHISLCWFHYIQCRGILQLLLWSWIQRGWTQLCPCENFSKYDCFLVSASKTYMAWSFCPQIFLKSRTLFHFFYDTTFEDPN